VTKVSPETGTPNTVDANTVDANTVTPNTVDPNTAAGPTPRARQWAETMQGHRAGPEAPGICFAHQQAGPPTGLGQALAREEREAHEGALLAPGATHAAGAGRRAVDEPADPIRTCFERDRDRILHSSAFRRLAGKTQVFIFPDDHQRTRLTHALEVAQVAVAIASAGRLNVALTEAIALGHDCGHGPGGHPSEDALSPYVLGGYDHAVWGADVALAPLNLCQETLDGVRNHSWSRPAPSTPEGEVVSWADRIAYVCHDWEDAVSAGIVRRDMLPAEVRDRCGLGRSHQLGAFICSVVDTVARTGRVGMDTGMAEALSQFRAANYEQVYMRPASLTQARAVIEILQALVEYFADRPNLIGSSGRPGLPAGSPDALEAAVTYVAGMTDRFACQTAVARLGWDPARLPRSVN
jgi:dGTPase